MLLSTYSEAFPGRPVYGALALEQQVGVNLLKGLASSIGLHSLAIILSLLWIAFFSADEMAKGRLVVLDPSEVFKLKPIRNTAEQITIPRPKLETPKSAIPIAVPQEEVNEEQPLLLTQAEMSEAFNSGESEISIGEGDQVVFKETDEEILPEIGVFVPFEVAPRPLPDFSPYPAYPEMAAVAGIGNCKVIVNVLVDKKGNVKKWEFVQGKYAGKCGDQLGFQEEIERVISKWKFAPAIQQGNPVPVTVAIPFNFQYKK